MKFTDLFKGRKESSRRDYHKQTRVVRLYAGDIKAVQILAKSHNMPAIKLWHQFAVQGCSKAVYEDIMKHEQRRALVLALCQGAGIKPSNIDRLIPKEESPGETPGAAAR